MEFGLKKKKKNGNIKPEPAEPNGVGIGDAFEVFAGHG